MAPSDDVLFLIRYGEIGLKSPPVRRRFERLLRDNIQRSLQARGATGRSENPWGRLLLHAPEAVGRDVLARTFGVVSFSRVVPAPAELGALSAACVALADSIPDGASFAVRARRSNTTAYTSMDLAKRIGADVLARHGARGLRVDLEEPASELLVEVRGEEANIGFGSTPGPGGLPVGSEGRVVCWVDGPRAALAAWLLMKRGCRAELLVPPEGAAMVKALAPWDGAMEQVAIDLPAPHPRSTVLALLDAQAERRKALGLVLGDGLLDALRLGGHDRAVGLPVFRPLLAMDAGLLAQYARQLGVEPEAGWEHAPGPEPVEARGQAEHLLRDARRERVSL